MAGNSFLDTIINAAFVSSTKFSQAVQEFPGDPDFSTFIVFDAIALLETKILLFLNARAHIFSSFPL